MIFDRFDHIRIINLAHRADRRRQMTAELARVSVQVDGDRVAFFSAIQKDDDGGFYSKGAHGCYLSHLGVLEEGGSVLLLEDDCDFTSALSSFDCPDFDILYGGYDAANLADLQNSDIIGAHMMGFSAETAKRVATYMRNCLDPEFRNHVPPPPADAAYVWYRRAYPETNAIFANPQLGRQRPSRTDIGTTGLKDSLPGLRSAVGFARTFKRRLQRA